MARDLIKKKTQIDNYEILNHIGSGGMGDVYKAKDTFLDRNVAIKTISAKGDITDSAIQRFILEGKALAAINHPNIVTIYNIGDWKGTRYIAMEYIDGDPLESVIKKNKLTLENKIYICKQLLNATLELHNKNIIHRDLKPTNILCEPNLNVKIIDFGIVKDLNAFEDENTNPGGIIGSLKHLAPELLSKHPVTTQTDIRSLGIIFYELFTGRYPFKYKDKSDLKNKIKTVEVEFNSSDDVPEEWQRVILRMSAISPVVRYGTIDEILEDVEKSENAPKVLNFTSTYETDYIETNSFAKKAAGAIIVLIALTAIVFGTNEYFKKNGIDLIAKLKNTTNTAVTESNTNQPTISNANTRSRASVQPTPAPAPTPSVQREVVKKVSPVVPQRKVVVVQPTVTPKRQKTVLKRVQRPAPAPQVVATLSSPTLIRHTVNHYLGGRSPASNRGAALSWRKVPSATYYTVEISPDINFLNQVSVQRTKANWTNWKVLKSGRYYWRVKAHKGRTVASSFSQIGGLNVRLLPPNILGSLKIKKSSIVSSAKELLDKTIYVPIKWNTNSMAKSYKVQASNSNFKTIQFETRVGKNYINVPFKKPGNYKVRVAALDIENNTSSYSKTVDVYLSKSIKVRTPDLVFPKNEARFTKESYKKANFKWVDIEDATAYQIQMSTDRAFRNVVVDKTLVISSYFVKSPLSTDKVYWRVRTISDSHKSPWSKTRYLIID